MRGERRVELGVPPPERIGRDVGIRGARQRPRAPVDPVQLELGPELVQHGQRDPAIRRQLPARDRDHPERAGREHRLAVRPRRSRPPPPAARERRRSARGRRPSALGVQGEPGLLEDLPLLRRRSARSCGRRPRRRLSVVPTQQASRPGDGEGDARPVDRDRDRGAPAAVALEHEVRAPAQRHRRAGRGVLEPPDVVDPRPGGVDDGARADLERLAGERVAQLGDTARARGRRARRG